jgi:hypothetical protein
VAVAQLGLVRPILALKASITSDFLRGILVAYVAYESYVFAAGLWVGFSHHDQPLALGVVVIPLIVYSALFAALLFWPAPSSKAVFAFLAVFESFQFAFAVYWLSNPMLSSLSTDSKIQKFRHLLICPAVVTAAYLYYRGVKQTYRPNQSLEPTAGRSVTSLSDDSDSSSTV